MGALNDLLALTDPNRPKNAAPKKRGGLDELLARTDPNREDTQNDLKDAGGALARGALDTAVGGTAEGALRMGQAIEADAAKTGGQGPAGRVAEINARRNELLSPVTFRDSEQERNVMQSEAAKRDVEKRSQLTPTRAKQLEVVDTQLAEARAIMEREQQERLEKSQLGKAAGKVAEFREGVRDAYPVDKDFERSIGGQVTGGVAQMVASLPAYLTGMGIPAAAGQMFDAGYQDAKQSGADDMTALTAGAMNLPGAGLEFAADKLALGGVLDAFKAGKVTRAVLAREVVKKAAQSFAAESATEGAQQVIQNVGAKALYDRERGVTEGAGEAMLVGGLTGATVASGSTLAGEGMRRMSEDTGKNVPESAETLKAQQQALVEGRQIAQMFPKGTEELTLPEGMERVDTPRGVFHFDPQQIDAETIAKASADGRENDVLGLGPASKADVERRAAAGEPLGSVVESTPDGREVKAAMATPSTAPAAAAEMNARKAPGNTVALKNPAEVVQARTGGGLVADLLAKDKNAAKDREMAQAREQLEREERQKEAAQKRARFDETITTAGKIFRDPQASFAQVQGALEAARFYAEDNSLGLTQEQREMAQRATASLQPALDRLKAAEDARRDAESQARQQAEAKAEAERKARIAADKQAVKAAESAGIGADGQTDYSRLTDDQLGERAQKGDARASKEMDRRVMMGDQPERANLRDVLAELKLPATDAKLGAELQLLKQEVKGGEVARFFSTKKDSLDRVAEALRERGFTQIRTPDDVIKWAGIALRGKSVFASEPGRAEVDFARGAPKRPTMDKAAQERTLQGLRRSSPELLREYDIEAGLVDDILKKYAAESGKRLGPVPDDVRAAVTRTEGRRGLIALAAEAFESRERVAALTTHEIAHVYFDTLSADTRSLLRELRQREMLGKTGPLYDKAGNLRSELAGVEDASEWGVKEWFAERIARLNEAWANGRIGQAEKAGDSLLRRLAYELREFVRKIWEGMARQRGMDLDSDLFETQFRQFWLRGADAKVATAASTAYAQQVEFARKKKAAKPVEDDALPLRDIDAEIKAAEAEMVALREGASQEEVANIEARGKALMEKIAALKNEPRATAPMSDEEVAAKVKPASALKKKAKKRPAKEGPAKTPEERVEDPEWLPKAEELDAAEVIASAPKVEELPPVDRKKALMEHLWHLEDQAKKMRAKDTFSSDRDAMWQESRAKDVRATLDKEFPGWNADKQTSDAVDGRAQPGKPPAPPSPPDASEAAQPGDDEPSPFQPEDEPLPVRSGRAQSVYGHSAVDPTALSKGWTKVREFMTGFRGSIPELPTFPAAWWNKSDAFLRGNSQFYARVKQGVRALQGINDYVQKTAEEKVTDIARPLFTAEGGKIDAGAYSKLKSLQQQAREAAADGRQLSKVAQNNLSALQTRVEASPYVLFQRLVMYLDFNWRQQNLKDSAGNPIALPGNVNQAEVKAELDRLSAALEASPHHALIKTALEKHMTLVRETAEDLKGRDLMSGDHLANPYYFPHLTLETSEGGKVKQRELRVERVKPGTEADFRGYLIDPVGSRKMIETDYVRAMYYHLVQVGAHNEKADIVRDFFRVYDVKKEVDALAKKLTKQRGRPVSWEQAWHEEYEPRGYVKHGTESGDAFPVLTINRDVLAKRLGVALTSEDLQTQLEELGLKGVRLLPDDIRETLSTAAPEVWIIPARVKEALQGISERMSHSDGAWDRAFKAGIGAWKAWKLFAPWNHIRYEYGNVVADAEKIFSADPQAIRYLARSAKELRAFWKGGTAGDDLRAAIKEGVLNTITAQEMKGLGALPAFQEFETAGAKTWNEIKAGVSAPLSNLTRLFGKGGVMGRVTSVEQSALREAITRYAKFRADLDRLRNGSRPAYAGAYWKDIDAIEDSRPGANDAAVRKAAAVSKATFGDYGDISVGGQTLRNKFIPFYSWMEVNFKYHANLFRNLRDMVRAGEMSKTQGAKAATRATAIAAGGVVLRLALPYVAVAMWNNSGDREEIEDELSEEDKRRFHIVLGRDDEGKALVVYTNTAFMDVARWFSGPEFMRQSMAWMKGQTDFSTAVASWRDRLLPDAINNTAGAVGPVAQIPAAIFTKKRLFPDVTDPRTIPAYDMRRSILGMMTDDFTADMIERTVNKDYYAAKDVGDWAQQLILQVRQRDAEAWAYYAIRDKAADFMEKRTGSKRDTSYDAPDQQVLRNFRKAIYTGDVPAAMKFYQRALEYGYTAERFAASVRAQDPLATLSKKDGLRKEFVEDLSPFDREQLKRAFMYYDRMNGMRGKERTLFPSERGGARQAEEFKARPRYQHVQGLADAWERRSEDETRRRAEAAEKASLAPARR
jgi:hypothetical protein